MFTRLTLGALSAIIACCAGLAFGDIEGAYYTAGFGNRVGTRTDPNVYFPWGGGGPGIGGLGVDNFSVSWRGQVDVPYEGNWTFTTYTDDGARLWVNGELLVNQWVPQGATPASGTTYLTAGRHDIVMDYFENGGGAHAEMWWQGPFTGQQVIPAGNLSVPQPQNTGILGRYYTLSGDLASPTLNGLRGTRIDNLINSGFGGDPIVGGAGDPNEFGVRWVGKLFIPTTGNWTLTTSSDDGARLYIDTNDDGNLERVVDQWVLQGQIDHNSPPLFLGAGFYDIAMEYFENGGGQIAQLKWTGPGVAANSVVPASAFGKHENGLITEFYNNQSATGPPAFIRNDSQINYDWGAGSPQDGVPVDGFSVRWRGKVSVPTSGNWTFYFEGDDGMDLTVNGQLLIDDFPNPHAPTELSGTVYLEAGRKYFIEAKWVEIGGGALAKMRWQGPTLSKQTVDGDHMYPILNEAPTDITLNPGSITDTQGVNAVVGLLSTTDPDNSTGAIPPQTHTYQLVGGAGSTHNGLFNINGTQLRQNNTLAAGSYQVRVRTTDNGIIPDNQTFEKALTVTVTDATPPVITLSGGTVTVECGSAFTDPGYTATDNVDGNITGEVVISGATVNTSVPGPYVVRYNVSDDAGNPATERTRTVNVVDTTQPVITLVGGSTVNVECDTPYNDLGATAADDCGGDLTGAIVKGGLPIDTSSTGTHQVTYNVVDAASNAATQVIRTVNVVDTTPPVISLNGSANIVVECGDSFTDPGASASDSCEDNLPVTVTGSVDTSNPANYVLTYNATDGANAAIPVNRTVTVQDTQPPAIALNGSANVTVNRNQPFFDPGAVATDACEGNVAVTIGGDTVDTSELGTYVVTYDAQDSEGHTATQRIRTIEVVLGNPPIIFLIGPASQSIECGGAYLEEGATASDFDDGDLTDDIVIAGNVDTGTPGTYEVTYNVTDTAGNDATEVSRIVNVVDTTSPTIALDGSPVINIECGDTFNDPGATAADSCEGDVTASIVTGGDTVDTSDTGAYVITYNVSDSEDNAAAEVTRTVNVIDTTLPILSLNGSSNVMLDCGDPYVDAGATASDTCSDDAQLTDAIATTGLPLNTTSVGSHLITYDVSDAAGNPALQITRTVTIADNVAPEITVNGPAVMALTLGETFNDPGASALDECEGDLPVVTGGDVVNIAALGTYIVTYNAQDSSGNPASEKTRTVVVSAGLAPVITMHPENTTVNFDATAQFSVEGAGLGEVFYQWLRNGVALADDAKYSGTQTATLSVHNAANADEGSFSVELTSEGSTTPSNSATLTVQDPGIVTQPASQTVAPGATVEFEVVAAGSPTLVYEWYRDGDPLMNGGNISGATTAVLTLNGALEFTDEGAYHVVVSNGEDAPVQSEPAQLQVGNPAFTQHPQSVAVNPATTVALTAEAVGSGTLLYRWQKDGVPLVNGGRFSGVNSPTLTISNVEEEDEGQYRLRVVGMNTIDSNPAIVTVNGPPVLSAVQVLPANGVVANGDSAVLSVIVLEGVSPYTYQWLKNGQPISDGPNISGSSTRTLEILSASEAQAGNYALRVLNAAGQTVSDSVIIKIGLQFSQNLISQTVEEGSNFQWTVRAIGAQNPPVYQWLKDDGAKALLPLVDDGRISGATTESISFSPIVAADEGVYVVEVSDGVDTVQSQSAALIVASNLPLTGLAGLLALSSALAAGGAILARRKRR